jgi:hypothetical protein
MASSRLTARQTHTMMPFGRRRFGGPVDVRCAHSVVVAVVFANGESVEKAARDRLTAIVAYEVRWT